MKQKNDRPPYQSQTNRGSTEPNTTDNRQQEQQPGEEVRYLSDGRRDWGGRARTGAEQSDWEERNKGIGGHQLRAAYFSMIGDVPQLGPDDRDGARTYLDRISRAISRGGWTKSEWCRLKKAHLKWYRRAAGLDPYFEIYGNKRQWADHGRTKRAGYDKGLIERTRAIRSIIMGETIEAVRRMPEETQAERITRLEEADRRHVTVEEFIGMD